MILGYVRVSTQEQAQADRSSLQEQENVVRGYAMTQGIDKFGVQIYSDVGISGSMPIKLRPAGEEMMTAAVAGDTIIASKMDRIFRSAVDALRTAEELKQRGIHLVLFDMGIQPITTDGMSKVFFTMAAAFAEFERDRIRERMAVGKKAKLAKGGHAGGEPKYGYMVIGREREAKIEINPNEQAVLDLVKVEQEKKGRFFSHVVMRDRLNQMGLKNRSGKPFEAYQIQRMSERLRATV